MEKDGTEHFLDFFISLGERNGNINSGVASEFVCRMYAQTKTSDINQARHNKLMQMTGKIDQVIMTQNINFLEYYI